MTRRRKRVVILAVVVCLGLIAVQLTMFIRPRRHISIEVSGPADESVVASCDVDGTPHKHVRKLPASFSFQARDVSFVILPEKKALESYVTVKVYVSEKHILSRRDMGGVKGTVNVPSLLGLGSTNNGIGGIRPDELAALQ